MATMELPDPDKDHDVVANKLDSELSNLLCSCGWTYDAASDFVEVIKTRHLGVNGLAKLT